MKNPQSFIEIILGRSGLNDKQIVIERLVPAHDSKVPEYRVENEDKVFHSLESGKLLVIQKMAEGTPRYYRAGLF